MTKNDHEDPLPSSVNSVPSLFSKAGSWRDFGWLLPCAVLAFLRCLDGILEIKEQFSDTPA